MAEAGLTDLSTFDVIITVRSLFVIAASKAKPKLLPRIVTHAPIAIAIECWALILLRDSEIAKETAAADYTNNVSSVNNLWWHYRRP